MVSRYIEELGARQVKVLNMSIKKESNGTWFVRVSYRDSLGKRHEKKGHFPTKTLASQFERQVKVAIDNGQFETVNVNMTTNQLFNQWFDDYKRSVKPVSYAKVQKLFEHHILTSAWFDGVKIKDIKKRDIQRWVNAMAKNNTTYKRQVNYFKKMLAMAVSLELMDSNPFDTVLYPKAKAKPVYTDRVDFYDRKQLAAFWSAVQDKYDNLESMHKLAYLRTLAWTGMRNGELRAITWSDVHLDGANPYIDVNKTMSEITGQGVVIDTPKTDAGKRTVKLDLRTAGYLKKWRAIQAQKLMAKGQKADAVWTNKIMTKRISANQPRCWLLAAIKGTDVPLINIHGLRHTYITLSVQAGMDIKTLQAQVGHDDIQTTLNIYASVTDEMRANTAEMFTSLVNF